MSAYSILDLGQGRMSTFGGPDDTGVTGTEGLALISPGDLGLWRYSVLFLGAESSKAPGLARRLNPRSYYLAMRWDEVLAPYKWVYRNRDGSVNGETFTMLRHAVVRLTNPENGFCLFAVPVDYGPGDGKVVDGKRDMDTGRLADLSPGAAAFLMLKTDDTVRCELILPEMEIPFGSKGGSGAPGVPLSGSPAAPGGKEAS